MRQLIWRGSDERFFSTDTLLSLVPGNMSENIVKEKPFQELASVELWWSPNYVVGGGLRREWHVSEGAPSLEYLLWLQGPCNVKFLTMGHSEPSKYSSFTLLALLNLPASGHVKKATARFREGKRVSGCQICIRGPPNPTPQHCDGVYRHVLCLCRIRKDFTSA